MTIALVGDGIENPHNARTLLAAASLFGADCRFHDRRRLCDALPALPQIALDDVAACDPRIAFDNLPGAVDAWGFRPPPRGAPALMVGNERHGLCRGAQSLATHAVQLPMASRRINTLNVAAAAGVALWLLRNNGGAPRGTRSTPERHRPDLRFVGPTDHAELGSAIRSAAAFGWREVAIVDRVGVWFGVDRATRAEGRAAARISRNAIRVTHANAEDRAAYDEVVVVTPFDGCPIQRANLARGARQLLVIPDPTVPDTDWRLLGARVTFVATGVPSTPHFRLPATIALAEAARQIGRPAGGPRGRRRRPRYDMHLESVTVPSADGEWISEAEWLLW